MSAGTAARFAAVALVVLLALLNTMVVRSSNQAPDDAYISLRYADNLAQGQGLRFNPGKERVEGFSSPLHVLSMASVIKAGGEPRSVSQFTSLSAALLTILAVALWGQRRLGILWGSAAAVALALNQGFSMWARGGLETTGFTLLILLALMAVVTGRWRTMGVLAGLLAVTRPEGLLYWLPLFAYAVLVLRSGKRPLREIYPATAIALMIFLTWIVFRLVYFHDLFPNTYYAKMDGLRLTQLRRGLEYLGSFVRLSEIQVTLMMITVGGVLYLARRRARPPLDWLSWQVPGLGLIVCSVFFILLSGGDWMNQHRFVQPVLPVLMLLAGWAGRYLGCLGRPGAGRTALTFALAVVFLSQPFRILSHDLRHPQHPLDRPLGLVEPWDDYNIPRLFQVGLKMRDIMPADATVAMCPVGAFSFACGRTTIDMLGLNDRQIARLPIKAMGQGKMGHEKGSGQVVLARRPDFILLRGNPNPDVGKTAPPDQELEYLLPVIEIWNDESFHRDYEPFLVEIDPATSFTLYRRLSKSIRNPEG